MSKWPCLRKRLSLLCALTPSPRLRSPVHPPHCGALGMGLSHLIVSGCQSAMSADRATMGFALHGGLRDKLAGARNHSPAEQPLPDSRTAAGGLPKPGD